MTHTIPQGTTEYQDFTLEADAVVIDLSGLTLGIEITDKHATAVSGAGTASVVTAGTGHVRFAPTGTNLTRALSPYKVRWTVTGSGRVFKVPNGVEPDKWQIVLP